MHLNKRLLLNLLCLTCFVTAGCSTLTNENVQGAYPVKTPKTLKGVVAGSAIGTTAALIVNPVSVPIGATVGGVVGGVAGYSQSTLNALINELRHQGVNVIVLGEYVELVLPSDSFFEPNETELKVDSYPILNNVTDVLKKMGASLPITLTGFTDEIGSLPYKLQLSKLQAQSVATYLWTHGINMERMAVYGGADSASIANPNTLDGRYYNRRIEITLRRTNLHSTFKNKVIN